MRILSLIMIIAFVNNCTAQTNLIANKDDNSLLWQITGNRLKQPSYLFGTFHLLCKEDIHFSNQLKKAVESSKEIYMELKMDDPAVLIGGLKFLYMKGDKKLKNFYTDSEYNKVATYFNDSLNTPLEAMQSMKPYFLMSLLYTKMLPCKPTSGVEEELVTLAKVNQKQIKGLETMEFQASVFDSIPYAEQAKDLLKSIDSINTYSTEFNDMLKVYMSQQINKIGELVNKTEFGINEHDNILLDDRNKNWVQQLKLIMANESVFVAVGCGHLVGDKGLIELLRKEGYIVNPLLNK
jgi:uncharacterized protein YbaP (TraB family)